MPAGNNYQGRRHHRHPPSSHHRPHPPRDPPGHRVTDHGEIAIPDRSTSASARIRVKCSDKYRSSSGGGGGGVDVPVILINNNRSNGKSHSRPPPPADAAKVTPPISPDDTSASSQSSGSDHRMETLHLDSAEAWVAFRDGELHPSTAFSSDPSSRGSGGKNDNNQHKRSLPPPPARKQTPGIDTDEEKGLAITPAATNTIPSPASNNPNGSSAGGGNDQNSKRRRLIIAAAVVLLVAITGIACGAALGTKVADANSTTNSGDSAATTTTASSTGIKAGGPSSTGGTSSGGGGIDAEELFSTLQQGSNGAGGQSNEKDRDGDGTDRDDIGSVPKDVDTENGTANDNVPDRDQQPQAPPQPSPSSTSCTDDATWLVVVVGDRGGKSAAVFTPYGCRWVATDPTENCLPTVVGANPTVSNVNRIGEVVTPAYIACPVACGTCGKQDQSGFGNDDQAQDVALTVATPSKPQPTSPKPTPAPITRPAPLKPKPVTVSVSVPVQPPRPAPSSTIVVDSAITCQSTAIDTNADEISLPFLPGVAVGSVDAATLSEASGLVASTGGLNPGILWTHNDAPKFPNRPNNRNRIYAIDTHNDGEIVAAYSIEGAKNIDWEDIAYGNGPEGKNSGKYIYLGDIGDNDEYRNEIYIYRVREPDVRAGGSPYLAEWDRLTLTYPDRRPRNVEAFLFDPVDEVFYLMTKRGGSIFSTPAKWGRGSTSMTLRQAGLMSEFRKQPLVGADISPDGREILLKYYGSVKYFCRDSESESVAEVFRTHDSLKLSYDREKEPKGEAVAWAKEGFYTLSEQDRYSTTPLYFYKRWSGN